MEPLMLNTQSSRDNPILCKEDNFRGMNYIETELFANNTLRMIIIKEAPQERRAQRAQQKRPGNQRKVDSREARQAFIEDDG
jgi:hypothetical protein